MNKKIIFAFISIVLISAASYGFYLYNKPHKNVSNAKAELIISSTKLINNFKENKDEISVKFIDKIIEVNGTITNIEESTESIIVILDNEIKCEFSKETGGINKGQAIKLKGIYSGYDEMFNEITLIRCHLIN